MEPSPPEAKYQEKETDEDMEPVKDAEPPSPSSSHPEIQKCSSISTQSAVPAVSTLEGQGTSSPATAIPAHMTLKLLSEMSGSARDINAGAPLSLEEWQAFEKELGRLAMHVQEKLGRILQEQHDKSGKMVQELMQLLVPAASARLADVSGFAHPSEPWAPASDATRFIAPLYASCPEPELFQGIHLSSLGDSAKHADAVPISM